MDWVIGLVCVLVMIADLMHRSAAAAKPVIVEHPSDATVRRGEDITLRCVVEHLPVDDLTPVQWTKDGFGLGREANLPYWERYSMTGDVSIGEYNLKIHNVSVSDDGVYECQVIPDKLRSSQARLTVKVPPSGPEIDGFDETATSYKVVAGKENEIVCRAFGGKPAATLLWLRDGVAMTDGDDVIIDVTGPSERVYDTSATLRLAPRPSDADAVYECVMTHDAVDQPRRQAMTLTIMNAPVVSVSIPSSVREHTRVTAECRAAADPPVTTYRWYRNGEEIAGETSDRWKMGTMSRVWHGARIGCRAQNAAGWSEVAERVLGVKYAPVLMNATRRLEAEIGDNVTLWCAWSANPAATVTWVRCGDGGIVASSDDRLRIPNVRQQHGGQYECRASSTMGEGSVKSELVVRGPPIIDLDLNRSALIGVEAVLQCSLSSWPGIAQVTWSWSLPADGDDSNIVEFTLSGNKTAAGDDGKPKYASTLAGGVAELRVADVEVDDFVVYQCEVRNAYGTARTAIWLRQDTSEVGQASVVGVTVGAVIGAVLLVLLLLFVAARCVRANRQSKKTTFGRAGHAHQPVSARADTDVYPTSDEVLRLTRDFDPRHSMSSHGDVPASTTTASDDGNPTPLSGQDDGYHTEAASSWNRNNGADQRNHLVKTAPSSPSKSSNLFVSLPAAGAYDRSYVAQAPVDEDQRSYVSDLALGCLSRAAGVGDFPPPSSIRPATANRYPTYSSSYDPTTITNPQSLRSASAMGERIAPPPATSAPARYPHHQQRELSDYAATYHRPPSDNYAHVVDYYPRGYAPMLPLGEAAIPPYASSSQSSLERGSALGGAKSSVLARLPSLADASVRSNLSSRAGSDRPITARMATHV